MQNKESIFWNWFVKHNEDYLNIDHSERKDELLDELLSVLQNYCDKLFFQLVSNEEKKQLIITADGQREFFSKVTDLVNAAPPVAPWEIIAFKPQLGTNFCTQYEGIFLDPTKLLFLPLESAASSRELGIRVYIDNADFHENKQAYHNGVYQLVDSLLGEQYAALNIDYIDVDQLPKIHDMGLIPLSDLQEYIEWRKSN